jgi:hypothetical protein
VYLSCQGILLCRTRTGSNLAPSDNFTYKCNWYQRKLIDLWDSVPVAWPWYPDLLISNGIVLLLTVQTRVCSDFSYLFYVFENSLNLGVTVAVHAISSVLPSSWIISPVYITNLLQFVAYFPEVGLCDIIPVRVTLCPPLPLLGNGVSSSTREGIDLSVEALRLSRAADWRENMNCNTQKTEETAIARKER